MTKSRAGRSHVDDRPHRRLPHAHPQRDPRPRTRRSRSRPRSSRASWRASSSEQGYIEGLRGRGARRRPPGRAHPDQAQVHRGPPLGDHRACERVSRPGSATTSHAGEIPKVQGGLGTAIVSTSQRRDDRPRRPRDGRRRRGRGGGLVSRMRRIGSKPIPVPRGVTVSVEPELVRVNGPKGELTERIPRDITVEQEDEELLVKRPTDRGEHRALHGLTRSLVANMVEGVTDGYEKRSRSRASATAPQLKGRTWSWRSATRTRCRSRRRTGSSSRSRSPRASSSRASPSSGRRDRRQHPQAAPAGALQGQGHPLRGRVRRPEGRQARMTVITTQRAPQAPPPRPREGRRHRRASAHLGVPLQPRHLRPAHRRRSPAARSPRSSGPRPTSRAQAGSRPRKAGELLAERAKAAGIETGRVRPRRLPVPRPRQGLRRRRPRGQASTV